MNLLTAIQNGDEFSFKLAYDQHREKVYFYFLKKTSSPEDAKDLLQITFLKLWQYRSSLSPEYSLDQQLFHIARTAFIDHLRKQNRQQRFQEAADKAFTGSSLQEVAFPDFDIQNRIQKALAAMPEMRKKVFELNRLQGYSYREIAELLSISEKSVDNHLTKAVRQLKKMLLSLLFLGFLYK